MMTFQAGLNNPDLVFSLGKTLPTSMTDLLFKAQNYMNKEDGLTANGLTNKRKKEENAKSQGKKRNHKDNLSKAMASKSALEASSKKKLNFTPLLMLVDKILMQIKDDPTLKWPKLLSSSSKRRDSKKYCRFHKDHGHYTNKYRNLKEQIEELIQRGKLQKFVKKDYQTYHWTKEKSTNNHKVEDQDNPKQVGREIRTITGGSVSRGSYKSLRKAVQRQVNSVHVKHPITKHHRTRNDNIVFSERDAKGIRQPHNDPLVIMLTIERYNTQRVLVDNKSSVDMMYMTAFHHMKLDQKHLRPFVSLLVNFSGDCIYPKGIISLHITAETHPAQVTREVDFLTADCPSSYNAIILGRPTLNLLKAATSTYCLKLKFPTPHRIGEICGDQLLARECYQVVLASKENHIWMVEEEPPKPNEEAKNIELVEGDPSKTTKVGKELQQSLKDKPVKFFENEPRCLCMEP